MTDDERDAKDWQAIKNFFDLKSTFVRAGESTARNIHSSGKATAVTVGTGLTGILLGGVSVKAAVATGVFAFGTMLSLFTFNPLPVLTLGALTVVSGAVASFAAKGAAWLLGAAKGAFLDAKYDAPQATPPAAAPAQDNAPSTGLTAKPAANDFNRTADPAAATAEVKPVQPEQSRGPNIAP